MISILCIFSDISVPLIGKKYTCMLHVNVMGIEKMHKVLIRKGNIFYCRFRRNRLVTRAKEYFHATL